MKIVDYETFVRMPAGTIFAPWEPCVMKAEPEIKVDHGREILIESGGKLKKIWYFNGTCPILPQPGTPMAGPRPQPEHCSMQAVC